MNFLSLGSTTDESRDLDPHVNDHYGWAKVEDRVSIKSQLIGDRPTDRMAFICAESHEVSTQARTRTPPLARRQE